jgi:hypothetical protein
MQQLRSVIDLREAALLSAVRAEETEKLKVVFSFAAISVSVVDGMVW